MAATHESIKQASDLFEKIKKLKDAKRELVRGPTTLTAGDYQTESFRLRGADAITTVRECAAADIDAQIAVAISKLADLGYEA